MNTLNLYLGTLRSENTKVSYGKDLNAMLKYINKNEKARNKSVIKIFVKRLAFCVEILSI